MKKLLVSVLAIAAMTACATDEVVRVQDSAAIAFEGAFVENTTRAGDPSTTTANINEFYVWAVIDEDSGIVFDDETVKRNGDAWTYVQTQYWTPGHHYYFSAIAGDRSNDQIVLDLAYEDKGMSVAGLGTATFTNVDGTNDFLYAEYECTTPTSVTAEPDAVKFQFDHLLSKVKFTFENGFVNDNNTIVVKNVKMTVPETATIDLTADAYEWASHDGDVTLDFGHMAGATRVAMGKTGVSDNERLTIPAGANQEYTVTFDVELWMGDVLASSSAKTIKINGCELLPGRGYNFKAEINQQNVDENPLYEIEFEVEVDEWEELEYNGGAVKDEVSFVSTAAELTAALAKGGDIILAQDIEAGDNALFTVAKGVNANIDLAGHTLSSTSSATGKNYNLFDVRGTLTIKNGTITTEHKGTNMGWSNSTNVFNVTAGGVLNLEGVTAKNLGGSDMAFVAHLNNWGEATLNVENSTLESTYIAVRAFNSGNDMNNVSIYNSTLKGKYCFWVHNYKAAGDNAGTDATLNIDIFNGTNTFEYTGVAPVLYGFNNPIYFTENGTQIYFDAETLAAALTADKENIAVVLGADIDLPISSLGQITGGRGEYKLGGENTKTISIDLNNNTLNITTTYWSDLGAKNADALFTIKNGTMTSSQTTGTWNSYDLCFSNCNYNFEDVVFEKSIALEGKNYNLKNVTINETHDYYAMWISAKGQNVTVDGLTINATNGRGIKIDEQYVSAPAKVTLNVANATFNTAKKAAVIVKSVAGAEINWGAGNDITGVAADSKFAVWVDEDAAAYADLVVVNGALVKVEGSAVAAVATSEELAAAIKDGAKELYLTNGNYTLASYPAGIKLIGAGDEVVLDVKGKKYGVNGDVTIENVKLVFSNANYTGFQHTNVESYKNCTIVGQPFLYGNDVTFEGCTFEQTSADAYNVWTYGAKAVKFVNCVFNSAGKSVLIYAESSSNGQVALFEGCELNASAPVEGKAAIEIDSSLIKGVYDITINDTTATGFANGNVSGNSLWNNKKGDKTTVIVDGVTVL